MGECEFSMGGHPSVRFPPRRIPSLRLTAGRHSPPGPELLTERPPGRIVAMHVNWAERGPPLIASAEVTEPMIDQALSWLAGRVPDAGMVLDIGSGPGV